MAAGGGGGLDPAYSYSNTSSFTVAASPCLPMFFASETSFQLSTSPCPSDANLSTSQVVPWLPHFLVCSRNYTKEWVWKLEKCVVIWICRPTPGLPWTIMSVLIAQLVFLSERRQKHKFTNATDRPVRTPRPARLTYYIIHIGHFTFTDSWYHKELRALRKQLTQFYQRYF